MRSSNHRCASASSPGFPLPGRTPSPPIRNRNSRRSCRIVGTGIIGRQHDPLRAVVEPLHDTQGSIRFRDAEQFRQAIRRQLLAKNASMSVGTCPGERFVAMDDAIAAPLSLSVREDPGQQCGAGLPAGATVVAMGDRLHARMRAPHSKTTSNPAATRFLAERWSTAGIPETPPSPWSHIMLAMTPLIPSNRINGQPRSTATALLTTLPKKMSRVMSPKCRRSQHHQEIAHH